VKAIVWRMREEANVACAELQGKDQLSGWSFEEGCYILREVGHARPRATCRSISPSTASKHPAYPIRGFHPRRLAELVFRGHAYPPEEADGEEEALGAGLGTESGAYLTQDPSPYLI